MDSDYVGETIVQLFINTKIMFANFNQLLLVTFFSIVNCYTCVYIGANRNFYLLDVLICSCYLLTEKIEIYLTFKALNSSCSGSLSLEEFYNIYSLTDLNWKVSPSYFQVKNLCRFNDFVIEIVYCCFALKMFAVKEFLLGYRKLARVTSGFKSCRALELVCQLEVV